MWLSFSGFGYPLGLTGVGFVEGPSSSVGACVDEAAAWQTAQELDVYPIHRQL